MITSIENGKATISNSFLLTGTGEEDKQFLDEQVQVEAGEASSAKEKTQA